MSLQAFHPTAELKAPAIPQGWALVGCLPEEKSLTETPLTAETLTIGRRPETDLTLNSLRVSGRHAELLFIGDKLFIRDLSSTNGTFLNRKRVLQPTLVEAGDHIEIADVEFRVQHRSPLVAVVQNSFSELKKTVQDLNSICEDWVLSQFHELIRCRDVTPHFQPILDLHNTSVLGYEALARSEMVGLENPAKMFETAELVDQEIELSVICRERAIERADELQLTRPIFVNTHPIESMVHDVIPSLKILQRHFPGVTIVVEFHEKSIESPAAMLRNKSLLQEIGVQVAYDDFGAGQSRLLELMKAPPDYLKFDRCLIKEIDVAHPSQWKMLKSLVESAQDVSIITLAEGIETEAEARACIELGFELGQGYFFGRPAANPHR